MVGFWKKMRLAKAALKHGGEFCQDCRKKFADFYKAEGEDTKASAFDQACDKCKPVVEKIYKEFEKGVFR